MGKSQKRTTAVNGGEKWPKRHIKENTHLCDGFDALHKNAATQWKESTKSHNYTLMKSTTRG